MSGPRGAEHGYSRARRLHPDLALWKPNPTNADELRRESGEPGVVVELRRPGLAACRPAELDVPPGSFGHHGLQGFVDQCRDSWAEDTLLNYLVLIENFAAGVRDLGDGRRVDAVSAVRKC